MISLPIEKDFPLLQALGADGKLSMVGAASVPAGKYGKAALTYLGVWNAVAPRVAQAENVRAALAFVASEAPLGIVDEPECKGRTGRACGRHFPRRKPSQDRVSGGSVSQRQARSAQFLYFLVSPEAAPKFEAQGFSIQVGK